MFSRLGDCSPRAAVPMVAGLLCGVFGENGATNSSCSKSVDYESLAVQGKPAVDAAVIVDCDARLSACD